MDKRQMDKIISAAAMQQIKLINEDAPAEGSLADIEISARFQSQMRNLLTISSKWEKRGKARKRLLKVAASFVLVLTIAFGAIMSADATRSSFVHFFERYFTISSSTNKEWDTEFNAQVKENVHNCYLPTWVPNGLQAIQSSQGQNQCTIIYKGNGKTIRFSQYFNSSIILSDNEVNQMEKITRNKQLYYYSEKNRSEVIVHKLVWVNQNNNFQLELSGGTKDDLIKIVDNLIFKKD